MDSTRAREALSALARELGVDVGQPAVTWGALWERYQDAHPVEPATMDTYRYIWRRVGREFAERDVLGTTAPDIAGYRERRAKELARRKDGSTTGRPVTPATRNREVMLLRTLGTWATKRGLIPRNPLAGLDDKEAEHNVRETVVHEPMLAAVLPWVPHVVGVFVVLKRDAGLRRKEAVTLRWDQVDFERGVIELSRRQTKGHRSRWTILSDRAAMLLRGLPRLGLHVFQNPKTGKPYTPGWFLAEWRKGCDRAHVEGPDGNVTLHDLRRTFATKMRQAGAQESEIMAMGGWRSAEVFTRYNIVDLTDIARARRLAADQLRRERKGPRKVTSSLLCSAGLLDKDNSARTDVER